MVQVTVDVTREQFEEMRCVMSADIQDAISGILHTNPVDIPRYRKLRDMSAEQTLQMAIGRLTTWQLHPNDPSERGVNPYTRVHIWCCDVKSPELVAAYFRSKTPERTKADYVIGAVWHGDHFGFHS